jgi:polyisoprenoid-binding protein YceI
MLHRFVVFFGAIALIASNSFAAATAWEIDQSHSSITFKIRHMMVSNVKGGFEKFSGVINLDEKDITKSTAEVAIDVASINTKDQKRDDHLRNADFFDVEKHKDITFKSKKFVKKGGKKFAIVGDMTMHGVTKEVTFDVSELTAPQKGFQDKSLRGLSATASINRKDFNMVWNKNIDKGGLAVGDKVDIMVELELLEKKADETKS